MCEILIRAVDAKPPTVAEWRERMARELPKARKFLEDNPDVAKAVADHARLLDYAVAKNGIALHGKRQGRNVVIVPTAERLRMQDTIKAYEADPLPAAAIAAVVRAHRDGENEHGHPTPSAAKVHGYSKWVAEVESARTDAEKEAEFTATARKQKKRGHVVVVVPDGHAWGRCECPPEYFVLRVLGMSVEDGARLLEPGDRSARKQRIDVDSIQFDALGRATITVDQLESLATREQEAQDGQPA